MRRKRTDPVLMGQPSPSLAKMSRMNRDELVERINRLNVEADRIKQKITNLSRIQPVDDARITALNEQVARLAALCNAAQERLAGKTERRDQRTFGGGGGGMNPRRFPRR